MKVGEFEGHVTLDLKQAHDNLTFVKQTGAELGLHYSEIAGWDEIRPGHHAFLTGHSQTMSEIQARMSAASDILERQAGIKVKRIKVELCTYDQRF